MSSPAPAGPPSSDLSGSVGLDHHGVVGCPDIDADLLAGPAEERRAVLDQVVQRQLLEAVKRHPALVAVEVDDEGRLAGVAVAAGIAGPAGIGD